MPKLPWTYAWHNYPEYRVVSSRSAPEDAEQNGTFADREEADRAAWAIVTRPWTIEWTRYPSYRLELTANAPEHAAANGTFETRGDALLKVITLLKRDQEAVTASIIEAEAEYQNLPAKQRKEGLNDGRAREVLEKDIIAVMHLGTNAAAKAVGLSKSQYIKRRSVVEGRGGENRFQTRAR